MIKKKVIIIINDVDGRPDNAPMIDGDYGITIIVYLFIRRVHGRVYHYCCYYARGVLFFLYGQSLRVGIVRDSGSP